MSPTPPLSLDRSSDAPLYRQIEDQLRGAIRARRLAPGSRVPSIRSLARSLGVARLTVVTAYEQLAADGYVIGRVGYGTVVAQGIEPTVVPPSIDEGSARTPATLTLPSLRSTVPLRPLGAGAGPGERVGLAGPIDLRPGAVPMDLFPRRAWERHVRDAWRELALPASRWPLDRRDPAGDIRLREALAAHLGRRRATRGGADRIVVTSGPASALAAVAALWLEPGRVAVVEEPGRPEVRRALELSGATVVGVPVDERGIVLHLLPAEASVIVVSPAGGYATGGTMPLARRGRLLAWASTVGAIIVEDDRGDEVRYGGPRPASLQGMDPEGRVIHLAAFDPVLYPALRTGAILVPDGFREPFAAVLESIDPGPSLVEQRALARFIRAGDLARYETHLRKTLGERLAALVDALGRDLGHLLSVEPVEAGFVLVGHLEDERWTAARFAEVARRAGVLVGLPACSVCGPKGDATERRVLFQFGLDPAAIGNAIGRVARAVAAEEARAGRGVEERGGVPPTRTGRRVAQP